MAAGLGDGGDEDGAESRESLAGVRPVVAGSASDGKMDDGMGSASIAVAVLVSSVIPESVKLIRAKQDDSEQHSVIDMHVPVDEAKQVEAIERGPWEHIVPNPADTAAIHYVNEAIIISVTYYMFFVCRTCGALPNHEVPLVVAWQPLSVGLASQSF